MVRVLLLPVHELLVDLRNVSYWYFIISSLTHPGFYKDFTFFFVRAHPMRSSPYAHGMMMQYFTFSTFLTIFLCNSVFSRVGRFTITNQQCSDDLQDNNSPVSTQLSSIVVSGVSDVTTLLCISDHCCTVLINEIYIVPSFYLPALFFDSD